MTDHLPAHPASLLFPLMDGIELNALVDNIRAHGLLEPIVIADGQILDGRNRLNACRLADIEATFVDWDSTNGMSPTEWVVSKNLHRRHLTTAQKAALALDLMPRLEEEALERMLAGKTPDPSPNLDEGRSDENAAKLVGVSGSTVATAKAIQKRDETGEVVNAMRAGELNIAQAKRATGFEDGASEGSLDNGTRSTDGRVVPVFFGKGDKWREATQPLTRYLASFKKRGYDFSHVNPKEAQKRVTLIDHLVTELQAARADLEPRSHKARPFSVGGSL